MGLEVVRAEGEWAGNGTRGRPCWGEWLGTGLEVVRAEGEWVGNGTRGRPCWGRVGWERD